jgi:hypothetical protein
VLSALYAVGLVTTFPWTRDSSSKPKKAVKSRLIENKNCNDRFSSYERNLVMREFFNRKRNSLIGKLLILSCALAVCTVDVVKISAYREHSHGANVADTEGGPGWGDDDTEGGPGWGIA